MPNTPSPLSPEVWLKDLFASQAVQECAVIRRKARDIERFAGMAPFMAEVQRRGYQVAENAGQVVIFCNRAPIRWLTPPAPPSSLSLKESDPKSLKDFGFDTTPKVNGR